MDAVPFPRPSSTCQHCGAGLPVAAKFCPFCGNPLVMPSGQPQALQVVCPTCTNRFPDGYRFCPQDGSALRIAPG
jgi:predicted amidophosphoribosyltransferase